MRLYSTPQSVLAGEITLSAMLETLIAIGVSIWLATLPHPLPLPIGLRLNLAHGPLEINSIGGSLRHVYLAIFIAPLLLLRTDDSQELALRWFLKSLADYARFRDSEKFWLVILTALIGRPLSVIVTAIRHPLSSLRAIPQNWSRVVLATDIRTPLDLVPSSKALPADMQEVIERFQLPGFARWVRGETPGWKGWTVRPLMILTGSIVFVPSFIYRFSLKSTALVYMPLLWILHDSLVDALTLKHKLEDIAQSPLETLKRWYSGFVIICLLIVPTTIYFAVGSWWKDISNWLQHEPRAVVALLSVFMPATPSGLHIEGWHLARGINAILTLVLLQWTYVKLRQIERGSLVKAEPSVATLNVWLLVRGLLTLYIIGCTLSIIISAVAWNDLWPIHIKWFPWK